MNSESPTFEEALEDLTNEILLLYKAINECPIIDEIHEKLKENLNDW